MSCPVGITRCVECEHIFEPMCFYSEAVCYTCDPEQSKWDFDEHCYNKCDTCHTHVINNCYLTSVFCSEECCKAFEEQALQCQQNAQEQKFEELSQGRVLTFGQDNEDEDDEDDSRSYDSDYPESDSEFSVVTQYTYVRSGKNRRVRQITGYIKVRREVQVE